MLTIDVPVGFDPTFFWAPILALAASISLAHFLSLQAELKPVWVCISKRTVHRR